MNTEWQRFLTERGAVIEDGLTRHFGDPRAEARDISDGEAVADLSMLGVLAVTGPDATDLLQGQTTCDLREVSNERARLCGLCSPKGRLLAGFRVLRVEDGYLLLLPRATLAATLQRLRMFVLRARVTLEDASDRWVVLGLAGPEVSARAGERLGGLPEAINAVRQAEGLRIVRVEGTPPRYIVLGTPAAMRTLWEGLSPPATPVGGQAWALTDILAGLPSIHPETRDAFVPQMVNYQALGGVSFTKGCYSGQEIVARMQYLGTLKRRMYRAHVAGERAPRPGDELFAPQTSSGPGAGRVVEAQPAPNGGYELLAVIPIDLAETGEVRLWDAGGPPLTLEPLPYPVEVPKAG